MQFDENGQGTLEGIYTDRIKALKKAGTLKQEKARALQTLEEITGLEQESARPHEAWETVRKKVSDHTGGATAGWSGSVFLCCRFVKICRIIA